jgi:hypothetical protein
VPLTLASLIPESLTAASPLLPFLALASRAAADVASLVLSFIRPLKLVLTFLISPPALISPLFSAALISPALASPVLLSPAHVSPVLVSLVLVFLAPALVDCEQCLSWGLLLLVLHLTIYPSLQSPALVLMLGP